MISRLLSMWYGSIEAGERIDDDLMKMIYLAMGHIEQDVIEIDEEVSPVPLEPLASQTSCTVLPK
ncbi:hypothetical protein KDH_27940 [Dictyobacter sp. S3.2.2.5]|uniref:Uncharacterized protein n=1 Tax=Dictyobacter halimunensis TaxID=3026934 RepID=A0ABQ6FQI7_9CHLR|nr:hypothetical protein KDH_27940 [Dictyobacter sp. S3.2.2.5]